MPDDDAAGAVLCDNDSQVAVVTLNRPEQRNAITRAMRHRLTTLLDDLDADPAVRVIVLTGRGRAFCSGHDVKEPPREAREGQTRDPAEPAAQRDFADLVRGLRTPSIAAVNGPCVAGGASLALGCDLRIATPQAAFGWPQPRLGLMAASGLCLAARALPSGVAMRHLLTGDLMDAAAALHWGLVDQVVHTEALLPTARELAARIVRCAPLAVKATRATVLEAGDLPLPAAIAHADSRAAELMGTADAAEGRAAFLDKRPPVWHGR